MRVGRRVSEEQRSGKGPNQSVEKRRENTLALEGRREARTVEPERAAVRERVEGRGARRAK